MKALRKNTLLILLACVLLFGSTIYSFIKRLLSSVNIQFLNLLYQLATLIVPILVIVVCILILTRKNNKNIKTFNIVLFICSIILVVHRVYLVFNEVQGFIKYLINFTDKDISYLLSDIFDVVISLAGLAIMIISTYLAYKNLKGIK